MGIIAAATRRRVTVAMAAVLVLVFGLISLSELKVNLLPDLAYPTLTVRTEYPGAAPLEIEKLLSEPLEEQLGVVKGLQSIRSISRTGQSDVLLEFAWGTDMDMASVDVREKLELIQLPLAAEKPIVLRFNPSTDPIMRFGLYDAEAATDSFDVAALKRARRFAEEELKKRLEPLEGVAAVKVSGGLEDEIQVNLLPDRLAQFQIAVPAVVQRLREENVNVSGGRLEQGLERYLVRTVNQMRSVEEFGDLILTVREGRPVRLRDVAEVVQGYKERKAVIRSNGREAVELAIYKEGDANTVQVAQAVSERLEALEESLPAGLELITVDDQSQFISQAISEVRNAALIGGVLAVLVIFLFLRDAWATAVISASIPVSVIAAFFLMDMAGLSLNIMSLGGIALAVGLLVDSAIVVLENIARHRAGGLGVVGAAVRGAQEVSGAVVAATLTTIAVFLPLVFVEGIGGQLFRDQALTVTFALLVALVVALTLIPMLSSLKAPSPVAFPRETLASPPPRTRFGRGLRRARNFLFGTVPEFILGLAVAFGRLVSRAFGLLLRPAAGMTSRGFGRLEGAYQRLLPWALSHRAVVLVTALVVFVLSLLMARGLGGELIPEMAQGRVQMAVNLVPGTPLASTDSVVRRLQAAAQSEAGIEQTFAVSGTGNRIDANPTESGENVATLLIDLVDGQPATEARAVDAMRKAVGQIPGVSAKFERPALFGFETPLEINLVGYDLETLKLATDQLAAQLRASDRFADVKSSLEDGHPEIQIVFDQERAAALGLTVRQISDQVVQQLRGEVATRYSLRDRRIDVTVRAEESRRSSVEDVARIVVNPGSERPVPLSAVAQIRATEGPAEIHRVDQERAGVVFANLRYGSLSEAAAEAQRLLDNTRLPFGVLARIGGQAEEMESSFRSLAFALALAVFLVYLVMASQFESLIHPLVILFSIPLALVGAIWALLITATPVSVIVFIGLIMLAGIVVNNAIVLIDLINQLRDGGAPRREAILQGAAARLRPIVMTTLTTVLGLLPLALGLGDGAEVRAPLAITVIGGLLVSTLLTLLVIPVLYSVLDRGRRHTLATREQTAT